MRTALARTDRYTRGAIAFHWSIALLVIVNLFVGLLHDSLLAGLPGGGIPLHKSIGFTVLVLTLGRIAWRWTHPAPRFPPGMARRDKVAARISHFSFYALLLLLPMSGWVMVSGEAKRYPLDWFGLFKVPYLPVTRAAGDSADGAHLVLGYLMLALVAIHVAAALRHHFVLRDGVLARMLPSVRAGA